MKTKKFSKKLSLNKKTIAHLNDAHMTEVKGGEDTGQTGCILCAVTHTCQTCPTKCIGGTCGGSTCICC
jgi:hypothetical protein